MQEARRLPLLRQRIRRSWRTWTVPLLRPPLPGASCQSHSYVYGPRGQPSGEKNMFEEFKKFAMRGNVLDLAVGVVIGAAFTGIVNSLVKDIIMPPIGFALGGIDFSNLFIVLKGGHAATLQAAQAAGVVTV